MGRGAGTEAPTHASFGRFRSRAASDPHAPLKVRIEPGSMDLMKGAFAFGYSDEIFDALLPQVGEKLGLQLVALWDWKDAKGYYGDAEVMVLDDVGHLRELPDPVYAWLYSWNANPLPAQIAVKRADKRTKSVDLALSGSNAIDRMNWDLEGIEDESTDEPVAR
jgi:hypothetical protein